MGNSESGANEDAKAEVESVYSAAQSVVTVATAQLGITVNLHINKVEQY
jgi:hypothetical protein